MSTPFSRLLGDLSRAWWRYVAASVAPHLPPRKPFRPTATPTRQEGPMLVYRITPAAPGAADVITHEITATIGDAETQVLPVAPGGTAELSLADDAAVTLVQVDIDDAGNRSEPSEPYSFVAADTIAPPRAGQPGVELVRED